MSLETEIRNLLESKNKKELHSKLQKILSNPRTQNFLSANEYLHQTLTGLYLLTAEKEIDKNLFRTPATIHIFSSSSKVYDTQLITEEYLPLLFQLFLESDIRITRFVSFNYNTITEDFIKEDVFFTAYNLHKKYLNTINQDPLKCFRWYFKVSCIFNLALLFQKLYPAESKEVLIQALNQFHRVFDLLEFEEIRKVPLKTFIYIFSRFKDIKDKEVQYHFVDFYSH